MQAGANLPRTTGTECGMTAELDTILPGRATGERSWLRRLWQSNAFTIGISLVLHGALFSAFYHVAFDEQRAPRRVVIPEARLAPIGGSGAPSLTGDLPQLKLRPPPPQLGGQSSAAGPSGPAAGSPLLLSDVPVVAVNLGSGVGAVVGDVEGSSRRAAGRSGADRVGGALMGAGYGGGGAGGGLGGPVCNFFGAAGNAYKVVYVVDISGSLKIYLRDIVAEMTTSIRGLTPTQQFQILTNVTDLDLKIVEFAPGRLVYATEKNKSAAIEFAKGFRVAPGEFDPVQTLTRAYEHRPELIYLLSDGEYDKFEDLLLPKVRELYKQCPAKITAISFNPSPRNVQLLRSVVSATGGNFRLVEESRLGR